MSIKVSDTNELANDTGSDTATDSHAKRLTLTRETLQVLRVRSTLRTGLIDAGHGGGASCCIVSGCDPSKPTSKDING
jgi:hypothetical protein